PNLQGYSGDVFVLVGDIPLVRPETLVRLLEHHRATGAAASLITAILDDPTGYGRMIRNPDGSVARIIEQKDATPEERAIREVNPSVYCFQAPALFAALREIRPNNVQGEYYLTDVVEVLVNRGLRVEAVPTDDPREVFGINSRVELAEAASMLR